MDGCLIKARQSYQHTCIKYKVGSLDVMRLPKISVIAECKHVYETLAINSSLSVWFFLSTILFVRDFNNCWHTYIVGGADWLTQYFAYVKLNSYCSRVLICLFSCFIAFNQSMLIFPTTFFWLLVSIPSVPAGSCVRQCVMRDTRPTKCSTSKYPNMCMDVCV